MKVRREYVGQWRIIEMSEWDRGYIDLVRPAVLAVEADGTGTFAFGAVEATVDCRVEKPGDADRLGFSFAGFDEGDQISGRGWARADGSIMEGWLCFHHGDESTFRARKGDSDQGRRHGLHQTRAT
jgi:hypothetical protein